MTSEDSPATSGDAADIRVTLARFEAKLDVALAHHSAKIEEHTRDIADLREERKAAIAKLEARDDAQEVRLREIEKVPTVTPRQLAGAAVGVVGVIGVLAPFAERLYS